MMKRFKKHIFTSLFVLLTLGAIAQVKIGDVPATINANSLLELESTNLGFVAPRMALDDASTPAPLLTGTIIYNSGGSEIEGYYFWNGSVWVRLTIEEDEPWRDESTSEGATYRSSDIYYTGGNIGLGNTAPNDQLDVLGSSQLNGETFIAGKPANGENGMRFHNNGTNSYVDSKVPTGGFTYLRADNTTGTTNRLTLNNTNGLMKLNNYGTGIMYKDSTIADSASAVYLLGVQADGDIVEVPNLKYTYFRGNLASYSHTASASAQVVSASEVHDIGSNYDNTNYKYVVPFDGLYLTKVNFQVVGGLTAAGFGVMIKVGTDATEDGDETWVGVNANSKSFTYSMMIKANKGDELKLYIDADLNTFVVQQGKWSISALSAF
jgi:hypothetical protein